jgi:hypothetical protein
MRLSLKNMRSRAKDLEELIRMKEGDLANAPVGKISICSGRGKRYYYYSADKPKGRKKKYLKKDELELAGQLAQRDYDERVVKYAMDELKTVNTLINKYERGTCEDIYGRLSLPRRELVTPFYMPDEDYVRKWLSEPYTGLGFEEGDPELYSEGGLRVRSKNEIIAADIYDKYGIPYKYECPLYLKGYGIAYPDFTLLNVRQRKVYYQEIMGKMTESGYADTNIAKIHAYERNGLIQGKNLILSFDTKAHPLLPKDIESVIKNFLL